MVFCCSILYLGIAGVRLIQYLIITRSLFEFSFLRCFMTFEMRDDWSPKFGTLGKLKFQSPPFVFVPFHNLKQRSRLENATSNGLLLPRSGHWYNYFYSSNVTELDFLCHNNHEQTFWTAAKVWLSLIKPIWLSGSGRVRFLCFICRKFDNPLSVVQICRRRGQVGQAGVIAAFKRTSMKMEIHSSDPDLLREVLLSFPEKEKLKITLQSASFLSKVESEWDCGFTCRIRCVGWYHQSLTKLTLDPGEGRSWA